MLTEIQKTIMRLYGNRHRTGKSELLMSKEVAKELDITSAAVCDELRKLRALGLLNVQGVFDEDAWSAMLTDEGLLILDEIGPISDK